MPVSTDLYVRLSDPSRRSAPIVAYHRVWDRKAFIKNLKNTHEIKAAPGDIRAVEIVDEATYRKAHGYKETAQ